MIGVWCLLCFFFGNGLTSSDVHRSGFLLQDGESVPKDTPLAGVMLVRAKRSPARTMTISGYLPNGGLSYASTDVMFPYHSMGYPGMMDMWPHSSQPQSRVPSKDLQPPSRSDYGSLDDGSSPTMENEPSWSEKETGNDNGGNSGNSGNSNGMTTYSVPKKTKKKQWFQKVSPPAAIDEDEDEGGRDGTAKAHASFNAWFPIMLGVFPYGQGEGGAGEAAQRGAYPSHPSQGSHGSQSHGAQGSQGSGTSQSQSPLQRYYSTTVIANSVNNGKSGIASSTATAYGSEQPRQ